MKQKYHPYWIIMWSEMGGNKGKQTLADFVYLSVIRITVSTNSFTSRSDGVME